MVLLQSSFNWEPVMSYVYGDMHLNTKGLQHVWIVLSTILQEMTWVIHRPYDLFKANRQTWMSRSRATGFVSIMRRKSPWCSLSFKCMITTYAARNQWDKGSETLNLFDWLLISFIKIQKLSVPRFGSPLSRAFVNASSSSSICSSNGTWIRDMMKLDSDEKRSYFQVMNKA